MADGLSRSASSAVDVIHFGWRSLRAFGGSTLRRVGLRGERDSRFREAYRTLLAQALACPQPGPGAVPVKLRTLRSKRRPLPQDLRKTRVVGFGTDDDWRRNGVWAAFRRLTDFQLFVVPDGIYREWHDEEQERKAKERDFLAYLDKQASEPGFDLCIFSHSGRHISDGLLAGLRDRGIWSVIMSADDQHQFLWPRASDGRPHQLRVAAAADLYWTSWRTGTRLVNGHGGNAWFAPHAADPDIHHPIECAKDLDVVFVGGCTPLRRDLVSVLERYFRVEVRGAGWPAGPASFDETLQLFSRAAVVIGVGAIGPSLAIQMLKGRDFEVAMCGAAYVTSANAELAECFDVGREVIGYASIEDCVESVAALLADPARCAALGRAARDRCVRDHTWELRVRRMFDLWRATD